jgi:hypothetical protein
MQVSKAHAKQTEILADYPAYSIYKPATNFRGDVFVTQNEYIRLPFNSRCRLCNRKQRRPHSGARKSR